MKSAHHTRRLLLAALCATLIFTLAFAVSRPLLNQSAHGSAQAKERKAPAKEKRATEQQSDAPTKPQPLAPATLSSNVATSAASAQLAREIDHLIDESEFAQARWGIYVMSLRDGRTLYARNADAPITPASNMKVYTTAVALDLLGADYRWQTSVYATAQPDTNGTIDGDLLLYGRGAPDFSSEKTKDGPGAMAQLADALYRRGVRRVRGRLIGDESYFRGDPLGDGWLWNDVQWYFGAEVSALTVNDNEVNINIKPPGKTTAQAAIKVEPDTDYVHLHDETNVVESNAPATLGITRGLSDNEVRVWGDFPAGSRGLSARLSIHQPALWAATLFRRLLRERGISVEGETQSRDARSHLEGEAFDPARAFELASVQSKSLGEIARATNKESINLNAELILRTLGKERGALAPESDQKKMRERNDDQAGLAVVRQWLEQAGIATGSLALHDGSGLSRLDLITPSATARLLANIARRPVAGVFRDSLPVAGRDGTLKFRLRSAAGRVLAKTGTLTYINSLSGYAITDDELLAFSIICNNETAEARGTRPIDAIAALLAAYSESSER
ncbi:MAG: serine-type D-Ala-D-Ala carboxypeptidase/endopeptidase (penicillin-binding protein 4) [Blastocatellia bacterium]|jgi:D-alanyl-D-alanine carboxypeptidase/D-alanyl-D-alanine-endopeptidase (penicillin-binding protein 4)|nr:serine-type D-Ala-D-Ala carboxypeptidase/endopeptidase (penicillin-binding protein 4) [Blastocatellia bacterium]